LAIHPRSSERGILAFSRKKVIDHECQLALPPEECPSAQQQKQHHLGHGNGDFHHLKEFHESSPRRAIIENTLTFNYNYV
jgi:hypothetical protein